LYSEHYECLIRWLMHACLRIVMVVQVGRRGGIFGTSPCEVVLNARNLEVIRPVTGAMIWLMELPPEVRVFWQHC
jgi:hypothetical protein